MSGKIKMGITHGMGGHFAVWYETESFEAIDTGPGRHETAKEAAVEAVGLSLDGPMEMEDGLLEKAGIMPEAYEKMLCEFNDKKHLQIVD